METVATTVEVSLTLAMDMTSFDAKSQESLKAALRQWFECHEPECLLTLHVASAASVDVQVEMTIPTELVATCEARDANAQAVVSATQAFVTSVAMGGQVVKVTTADVVAAGSVQVASCQKVAMVVAPPPPMPPSLPSLSPPPMPPSLPSLSPQMNATEEVAMREHLSMAMAVVCPLLALLMAACGLWAGLRRRRRRSTLVDPGAVAKEEAVEGRQLREARRALEQEEQAPHRYTPDASLVVVAADPAAKAEQQQQAASQQAMQEVSRFVEVHRRNKRPPTRAAPVLSADMQTAAVAWRARSGQRAGSQPAMAGPGQGRPLTWLLQASQEDADTSPRLPSPLDTGGSGGFALEAHRLATEKQLVSLRSRKSLQIEGWEQRRACRERADSSQYGT